LVEGFPVREVFILGTLHLLGVSLKLLSKLGEVFLMLVKLMLHDVPGKMRATFNLSLYKSRFNMKAMVML
jgi:hypothetical protein